MSIYALKRLNLSKHLIVSAFEGCLILQNELLVKLLVGDNQYGGSNSNVGITGSTTAVGSKSNIGVLGSINGNSSLSGDKNYGILGIVSQVNTTHGKNYGLSGMIGFTGSHYGGAGVYGTNYSYYYNNPTNIQGDYAGYFQGPVKVTGNITAPSMYVPTDSRLSENVVSLNERGEEANTLDNLLAMNVIEYNMKSRIGDEMPESVEKDETGEVREAYEYLKKDEMKMCSRRHFGIDAEELQKVYPDLVLEGQDGYLSVNYVELVPLLIRSIQELKQQVDELQGKASSRQTRSMSWDEDTPDSSQPSALQGCALYQNTPNPFSESTTIRFTLPEDAHNAFIYIFDMNGRMQKQIPVDSSMQSVTISGGEFPAGIYLYSLAVGGKEIDTKRMILSK